MKAKAPSDSKQGLDVRVWAGAPVLGLRCVVLCAFFLGSAKAQALDETCTVSVLNRTAPVDADGVWVLPNVPSNMGPVRVRATCVDGDTVRSGQSEFFTVPTDGVVQVADVVFDAPEPVPARLTLTAPTSELTTADEIVQLIATAILPDGTSVDVTGSAGTSYSISSPAIATVDVDGRVTAVGSGTVLVSVLHEGALALLTLRVVLAADSDSDGLPDDFEVANGLDPNNAADALLDADEDGLTMAAEFEAGLDPFDPDTDADGLLDGRELLEVGTDPLRFDSDGDAVSDGLEVGSSSDPLDRFSVNLPPILSALTVEPASFELVFNTVVGESSRRLRARATLVDGTVLDATGVPYGSVYTSSDLTVASFGLDPGRVFAGQDGLATVTASNGAFNASSEVTVRTFSPTALSFLPIPGFANSVDIEGALAAVAAGARGLYTVDVSSLEAPFLLGSVDTPGNANDVRLAGELAYVADGARGLAVVDLSNPAMPVLLGSRNTDNATDLVLSETLVYLADGRGGLRILDVADPANPVLLGSVETPGLARGVDVSEGLAVVAGGSGGVHVIDVRDPAAPVLLGSTHTRPDGSSRAAAVVVRDRRAYVADGASLSPGGLRVVDFQAPSTPVVVGSTGDAFGLMAVALEDDLVLAADYFFANAVPIFGVATDTPAFQAVVDFSGIPSLRDDEGHDLVIRDGVVFLTGALVNFRDNGALGDGGLHIGRYRLAEDGGPEPPSVTLTVPEAGQRRFERTLLTVRAAANDDVRVGKVEFLVDGEVVRRDFTAPFEHTLRLPAGPANLVLDARATDLGGRTTPSTAVVLEVLSDTAPTADLLSPVQGQRVVEGSVVTLAAEATDDAAVASVELLVDGASAFTLAEPPYRFDLEIPLGSGDLTVAAAVTDSAGQTAVTEPRLLAVDPDPAPEVVVLSPVDGSGVVRGMTVPVVLGVIDNREVLSVGLRADGLFVGADTEAPWEVPLQVPETPGELTLEAVVFDAVGQTGSSPPVVVTAIDDPLTTVFVDVAFEGGAGVAGAEVRCSSLAGLTGDDGTVTIPSVPTISGILSCAATFVVEDGTVFAGTSSAAPPVPGGLTDAGTIVVAPAAVPADLGFSLELGDDDAGIVLLPFLFPFYGELYDLMFVNSNGTLSFDFASPLDGSEDTEQFLTGLRDFDVFTGPTLAVFWDDLAPQPGVAPLERNIFVDDRQAGRVTVTWNQVGEYPGVGSNTFRVVLHQEGRIEFVYAGMTADDALVGLSPVTGDEEIPLPLRAPGVKSNGVAVDFSADVPLATGPVAIFEEFDGPDGPDGRGEDPPGERPFDLDGRILVFTPRFGGYDVALE